MKRAHFPFLVVPSHAVAAMIGRDLDTVAILALKAILQHPSADPLPQARSGLFVPRHPQWRPDHGA